MFRSLISATGFKICDGKFLGMSRLLLWMLWLWLWPSYGQRMCFGQSKIQTSTAHNFNIAGRRQKIKKTVESVDVGVSAADVAAVAAVVVVVVVDGPVAMLWILPPASVGMWPQT